MVAYAMQESSTILPETRAAKYDVAAFRGIEYPDYRAELRILRRQLLALQEWVVDTGGRLAVVLEGRDAAGKGSTAPALPITSIPSPPELSARAYPTPRKCATGWADITRCCPGRETFWSLTVPGIPSALVQPAMGYCLDGPVSLFYGPGKRLGKEPG